MPLFDTLAGLFTEGRAPAEFLRQLQLFAMSFLEKAPKRFGLQMMGGSRCGRARCVEKAVAICEGCGTPICLSHGYYSHEADSLCAKCARLAVRNIAGGRSWGNAARHEPEEEAPRPADPRRIDEVTIAYMTLGIPQSATLEQAKRRFRMLTLALHPDRIVQLPETHRAEATEMFTRYSSAYSIVEKRLRRKAA